MQERWFYTHDGRRHGPVTADDLDRLTAEGQLQPTDLLWRMGSDLTTAVEAGTVLIALAQTTGYVPNHSPSLPQFLSPPVEPVAGAPAVASAIGVGSHPAPDWVQDWQASSLSAKNASMDTLPTADPSVTESRVGPCPDWLQDMRHKDFAVASAPPQDAAHEPPANPPPPLGATTSESPIILLRDGGAKTTAASGSAPTQKLTPSSPGTSHAPKPLAASASDAIVQKARAELETWIDTPANRPAVVKGDVRAILSEPTVQAILAKYRSYGAAVQERMRADLRALVENRRRQR